jgi:hypothetical protein
LRHEALDGMNALDLTAFVELDLALWQINRRAALLPAAKAS